MISLDRIRQELSRRDPHISADPDKRQTAVAMVLCGPSDRLQLLFIERATHPSDPWSGNLAFPGGRVDPGDPCIRAAAEREAREELDLDPAVGRYLGRLDDIVGAHLPVIVACFVYHLPHPPRLRPNEEVADAFWFPLNDLLDTDRHKTLPLFWQGEERTISAIDLVGPGRPVLWGITYRLVCQLLHRLRLLPESTDRRPDD